MSQHPPFRPFETLIDEQTALAILRAATDGAEDGELFLERRRSEVLVFDDGRVRTASYHAAERIVIIEIKDILVSHSELTKSSAEAERRARKTMRRVIVGGGGDLADVLRGMNLH